MVRTEFQGIVDVEGLPASKSTAEAAHQTTPPHAHMPLYTNPSPFTGPANRAHAHKGTTAGRAPERKK